MWSVPKYCKLFSVTSRMRSGRESNAVPSFSGSLKSKPNFVASTTSSRMPFTARPTSCSLEPVPIP